MARLPQPGADKGTWGEVLNDYLNQSHATDGTLQPDSVGTPQLQPNAVTAAALAPDSVTSNAIAPNSITSTELASNSVTAAIITDGTITSAQLNTSVQATLSKATTALQAADITGKLDASTAATTYAAKFNEVSRDSTTQQWHFDVLQGTNNGTHLPFTSRVVNSSGVPVAEQINAKPTTDVTEGVIDWQHNSTQGDLIHLTAGAGMSSSSINAALIALGLDNGYPLGLFVNNKGHSDGTYGIGIKIAQNSSIDTATGSYGLQVDQMSSTSPAVYLHQTNATAPLLRLQADTVITSTATALLDVLAAGSQKGLIRAKTGELYWLADVITHDGAGFLNIASGASADSNMTKQLSDGFHTRAYAGTAGIYYPGRIGQSSAGLTMSVSANTSGGPTWTGNTWQTGVRVKVGSTAASTMLGISAPATTATEGFPYMPNVAGAPTGVPTAQTGYSPFAFDTVNNKLWVYNGGWKGTVLS